MAIGGGGALSGCASGWSISSAERLSLFGAAVVFLQVTAAMRVFREALPGLQAVISASKTRTAALDLSLSGSHRLRRSQTIVDVFPWFRVDLFFVRRLS